MCFEPKSTGDPKVLCSTKITSKRNSSMQGMNRSAINCDLTLENVRKPFVSHSAATQTRWGRLFERLQLHQTATSCTSSENIVLPSNGSSYPFKKKTIDIRSKGSPELSDLKQLSTFRTARRNPLKTPDVIRAKKKSSAVRASASRSKKLFSRLLSYYAEVCFRVQQTLS